MASEPIKSMQIRRHVIRSTASNLIGQFVVLGLGFVLSPFILRRIGVADYGLWVLVTSITGYGSVLEFGISSAVIKYVAEYRARGEGRQVTSLVATALTLYTILGLVAIVLSLALALLVPHVLHIAPGDQAKASRLVLLAGIGLGISIPSTITNAVLRGLQRFDLINLLVVVTTLLSTAATIGALLLGWGVLGLAAVGIPITLAMQVPGVWIIHRIAPELVPRWRGARRSLARTVTTFSLSLFVVQVARQLQMRTDEVVIGLFLPITSVTPYSFARRLGEIPNLLTNQFIKVLMPLASGLHAEDDWSRLRAVYIAATRLALAISLAIAGVLVMLARPLLTVWIGPAYAGNSVLVLIIGLSSVIAVSQYPAGAVLQGIARHRILAWTSIGSGIVNLVLSIVLVRRFGLVGVAIGTLIPTTAECILFVLPYSLRVLGVRPATFLREAFLPAAGPTIPMLITLYILQSILQPASLIVLAGIGLLAAGVYALGYFSFEATTMERQVCQNLLLQGLSLAKAGVKHLSTGA